MTFNLDFFAQVAGWFIGSWAVGYFGALGLKSVKQVLEKL